MFHIVTVQRIKKDFPRDILKKCFVAGEIKIDEYREKKKILENKKVDKI